MNTVGEKTSLAGQTAIVTGGAKGLGLAISQRLAAAGCRVVQWDVHFDESSENGPFSPLLQRVVDVSDLQSVEQAFAATVKMAGSVEILVNNAGISGPIAPTEDYPPDVWQRVLNIDLNGVFFGCRTAIPHMKAQGYGRIINVASIAGKEGNAFCAGYAAAKGGVIALTKTIGKELAGSGILVNALAPAMAETELVASLEPDFVTAMKSKIPMGRFLQLDEVGEMVAWMASPACSFTTGFTFDLSGGRATY
jgi:3-oxoacyl-[acyl-carrier protein] reductase